MNIIDIINKTKHGKELNDAEIEALVRGFTNGEIPDYQMSAWLMAVCLNGLTDDETAILTYAMRDTGKVMDLSCIGGTTIDKHSTGGVGDKTSLIIGPIAAACGVYVPKMSGRGLGHTGGTIDKLESINGYNTQLALDKFLEVVSETGFSIISQSEMLCPADKLIYSLRNATGTVDSIPLICSSIMSKKLAMNCDCILLDVKYGSGAFMKTYEDACRLGELMERTGKAAGKKCRAIVTDMNIPLGKNIGNALEVREAVDVLSGQCRGSLYDLCIGLSADMLELAGKGTNADCIRMAENAIASGKALSILERTIELHGGDSRICRDTSLLPQPRYSYNVRAAHNMKIISINSEEIGMTSLLLGAGRISKEDKIDMSAGIVMNCECGQIVGEGETIMTLCSSVCSDFTESARRALNAVKFVKIL